MIVIKFEIKSKPNYYKVKLNKVKIQIELYWSDIFLSIQYLPLINYGFISIKDLNKLHRFLQPVIVLWLQLETKIYAWPKFKMFQTHDLVEINPNERHSVISFRLNYRLYSRYSPFASRLQLIIGLITSQR